VEGYSIGRVHPGDHDAVEAGIIGTVLAGIP